MASKLIPERAAYIRNEIRTIIQDTIGSISSDCWTAKNSRVSFQTSYLNKNVVQISFVGVLYTFIDKNWKRQSFVLGCKELTASHTGSDKLFPMYKSMKSGFNISIAIKDLISLYKVKAKYSCSDSAANQLKAISYLGLPR